VSRGKSIIIIWIERSAAGRDGHTVNQRKGVGRVIKRPKITQWRENEKAVISAHESYAPGWVPKVPETTRPGDLLESRTKLDTDGFSTLCTSHLTAES